MSGDWSEEGGFDSYDFGSNYPENYSAGSDELTNDIMKIQLGMQSIVNK